MTALRENDHIILIGDPAGRAEFSHSYRGVSYYRFPVSVGRLSGARDELNVLAPEEAVRALEDAPGARLFAEGEVRSFNNRSGVGAKLVISVFARRLARADADFRNELTLGGIVVKPPVYRRTPMGREITDLLVAVPRRRGRSDYLPVIAWGAEAVEAADFVPGDRITLRGRLQSRRYVKDLGETSEERTAYEVSAAELARE